MAIGLLLVAVNPPAFAGWLGSGTCDVQIRQTLKAAPQTIQAKNLTGRRLYCGQYVRACTKGTASLLVFGHEKSVSSKDGWWKIPNSAAGAPKGRDIQAKYTQRGGRERGGDQDPNTLWYANSLELLAESGRDDLKIAAHLTTGKKIWSFTPKLGSQPLPHLTVGDKSDLSFEILEQAPVYVYYFDVGPTGKATRFFTDQDSAPRPPTRNHWIALSRPIGWSLPDGRFGDGEETLYLLATLKPLDTRAFDSRSFTEDPAPNPSPLTNLFGSRNAGCDKWTLLSCRFLVGNGQAKS